MLGARGTQKGTAAAKAATAIGSRVRVVALIATAVALAGLLVGPPAAASAATPTTKTFSYTGGGQTFTVPDSHESGNDGRRGRGIGAGLLRSGAW